MTILNVSYVENPDKVDPDRLLALLIDLGWTVAGERRGIYKRLVPPVDAYNEWGSQRWSLLIPLDRTAPDFSDAMRAVVMELNSSSLRSAWSTEIAPRLASEATDSFRFRKESAAPAGLISWKQGEELINAAHATLVAGAKAYMEPLRRYSNKHGQFASRYLDSVFMGQTAIGSYIVTAYAPAQTPIALSGIAQEDPSLPYTDTVPARLITASVATSLAAVTEAMEHYREAGSLSGFDQGVQHGISHELTAALSTISRHSDGGDISIDYDPTALPDDPFRGYTFEFTGADTAVFEQASQRLAVAEESPQPVRVIGRVHLLTKKLAGGPGVFGIEVLSGTQRKFRVRLSDADEYHLAVRAHDEDLALYVFGDYERDGNLNWLYNAHIGGIAGPVDALREQLETNLRYVQERLALDVAERRPEPDEMI